MSLRKLLGVLLVLAPAVTIQAQTPALGPQFQVNSYTTDRQAYPRAALDAAGDFVVCWQSEGQDGDGYGIFEQFVPAIGSVAPETQVDTQTSGDQRSSAVAIDSSGNFVVVWESANGGGPHQIRSRRFDNTGAPIGPPVPIGTGYMPQIAMRRLTGDFVVVWESYDLVGDPNTGVSAQRFDASGNPIGSTFQVNTYTTGFQDYPTVALDTAGDFIVSWMSEGQDGDENGVFAQLYDATATKVGGEFRVNTYTTGSQSSPAVGMDSAGNFVVVWQSEGPDGDGYGVVGQRYDTAGNPRGSNFLINTFTTGGQQNTGVVMDPSGNFLVIWDDFDAGGIYAQRFNAAGARVGTQFPVIAGTFRGSIAYGSEDELLVAGQKLGDDGLNDVWARGIFPEAAHPMAVDTHSATGTTSNLNGVLEVGETVLVAPAWKKYAPAGFTGTATALDGPPGPTYTLNDGSASYVSGAPTGSIVDCFDETGDCYQVTLTGARPAAHWDATLTEVISTGATKVWTLHVGESFPDVPTSSPFYAFIENLFHNGITGGCGGGDYCPTSSVTRAQMAVFLLKAEHGSTYVPPACTGVFGDVSCPSQFADWIEQLSAEGITGGCGGGDYCPGNPVTRAQMAVFLLKAEHGSTYVPPACAGIFGDVPCPSQFANWIEQLSHEGITGGCGGGDYCPGNPNTRGQMAVFLVKTFGLELYGP